MFRNAAIIGVGQSAYTRRPEPGQTVLHFMRDAVVAALKDAQLSARDIQGFAVASFSLAPDAAIDLAWKLGLSLRWIMQDTNGGSSAMNMLGHALRGVEAGAAETILVLGGDATGLAGYAKVAANFNTVTQKHLAPLGHGGPNGVYALVANRQMKKYGLQKSDYGHIAVAQREWAAKNPFAVYRTPLTMDEYLAAPMVADPLSRYDCVPVIAGAQAIDRGESRPCAARAGPACGCGRIAAASTTTIRRATGSRPASARSRQTSGATPHVQPDDIDLASIYDDYPTMVLAQANDLGLIPDNDLARFCRVNIGEKRFPVNTWGGMLSAGQPGGFAGGLNGITEAVLQLQHRAGERQVKGAKLAVATGYGMTMYRYGGTAAAAILERVE